VTVRMQELVSRYGRTRRLFDFMVGFWGG